MHKHPKLFIGTALMALALPLSLMVTSASAATAHPRHLMRCINRPGARRCCIPDNDGDCQHTVPGTAWPIGGLNIRTGPGTGYVNTMPQNSTGTVYCYATGPDINGNRYWDQISSSYGDGYVSDYYFYTGGNISQQVDPC